MLNLGERLEQLFGGNTLENLGNGGRGVPRSSMDKGMQVIAIRTQLNDFKPIPFANLLKCFS